MQSSRRSGFDLVCGALQCKILRIVQHDAARIRDSLFEIQWPKSSPGARCIFPRELKTEFGNRVLTFSKVST